MRQALIALAVVVSVAVEGRASIPGFDMRVTVTRTPVVSAQRELCGKYEACTHFVAPMLSGQCKATAGGWSIDASARVNALVYLLETNYLAHEHEHLRDMRHGVDRLLRDLESKQFESEQDCYSEVRRASDEFRGALRKIAADSVARRR